MEATRLFLAGFLIIILPIVIVFWLFIHAVAERARSKLSALAVYSMAGVLISVCGLVTWMNMDFLLGHNLGLSWPLFIVGALIYVCSHAMAVPIRSHLSLRTFAGIPEVAGEEVELLDKGPYAVVRHPRYLMVVVGVAGWALMANYSGAYLVSAISILGLFAVMSMEERDLVNRFGADYLDYKSRVPQILPRRGTFKQYFETPE